MQSISDQLKRDILVEGSVASKLDQPHCDCLVVVKKIPELERASKAGSVMARGDLKLKVKTLGLGGDGAVKGPFTVKRLQS